MDICRPDEREGAGGWSLPKSTPRRRVVSWPLYRRKMRWSDISTIEHLQRMIRKNHRKITTRLTNLDNIDRRI
jgi:hypothetical protein